jgi:hypothetical protein
MLTPENNEALGRRPKNIVTDQPQVAVRVATRFSSNFDRNSQNPNGKTLHSTCTKSSEE